ncbi:IclR family transcriptional regulator [Verticiella sediminum]|uniref:IclR family transcriptional regulator n=1 Tax=Verticiella sediminum TaxID=1247510 RepID=A0A556AU27_9BURK|nr:IclR family transcriptional regulator [Verticiella sediminum]TSH96439.1 IclR family transcriptional regulator [Verticiella sediminum]
MTDPSPTPDEHDDKSRIKEDRHFVSALARGLEVLTCFRDAGMLLGNQEIAERSRLPKSTVSRLTYTLTKLGYLDPVEGMAKYRLGTAAVVLGASALTNFDIRRVAVPLMQELADFARASVSLGVRERLAVVYIDTQRGAATFSLNVDAGWRVPIATTAIGRAYIASCGEAERAYLLDALREDDPAAWPQRRAGIEAAIQQFREIGCCTSFGEWQSEVNSIATTISRGPERQPMVINCGGPAFMLTPAFLVDTVRPRLIEVARSIQASAMRMP